MRPCAKSWRWSFLTLIWVRIEKSGGEEALRYDYGYACEYVWMFDRRKLIKKVEIREVRRLNFVDSFCREIELTFSGSIGKFLIIWNLVELSNHPKR